MKGWKNSTQPVWNTNTNTTNVKNVGTIKAPYCTLQKILRVRSMNSVDFRRGWLFLFFYGFCIPWEKKSILHLTHRHKKKLEEKRKKKKETFINLRNLLIIGGLMATVKMSQGEQLMIFIQILILNPSTRIERDKNKKIKKIGKSMRPMGFWTHRTHPYYFFELCMISGKDYNHIKLQYNKGSSIAFWHIIGIRLSHYSWLKSDSYLKVWFWTKNGFLNLYVL